MSIRELYQSRCKVNSAGELVPTYWIPQAVDYYPICLYSSVDRVADPQAISLVQRLITLALRLEVEVGTMVVKGVRRHLPKADKELTPLLMSNASDEGRHYRGFQYAQTTYGSVECPKLDTLVTDWLALGDSANTHPVHIAGLLEVSVFLISLGLLRIVGSPSLSRLAMAVAEDEYRHVQTNVAVSSGLGYWGQPSSDTQGLIDATLEWMWGDGLDGVPKGLSLPHLKEYSRELVADMASPRFDNLTWYSFHHLPFELPNEYMYSLRDTNSEATA